MALNGDQGAGAQQTQTRRRQRCAGRGDMALSGDQSVWGETNATAAAKDVWRHRRDGAERRSKSMGREKHNGGGDRGAAAEERWR